MPIALQGTNVLTVSLQGAQVRTVALIGQVDVFTPVLFYSFTDESGNRLTDESGNYLGAYINA